MSKVCSICGKGRLSGNKVSHSNRKYRRAWGANVQKVELVLEDDEQERRHRCRLSLFDKVQDAERRPFFMLFRRAATKKRSSVRRKRAADKAARRGCRRDLCRAQSCGAAVVSRRCSSHFESFAGISGGAVLKVISRVFGHFAANACKFARYCVIY